MNSARLDQTFAALSDPARRDLLRRLAGRPQTAGELAAPFAISRPAVSRHLRVLRDAGLVRVKVSGRQHWYHLEPAVLDDAQEWMDDVRRQWRRALRSLKEYVEKNATEND